MIATTPPPTAPIICPHIMQASPQLTTPMPNDGALSFKLAVNGQTVRLAPPKGTVLGPFVLHPNSEGIATIKVPQMAAGTAYLVIVDGIVSGCNRIAVTLGSVTAP